MAKTKTRDDRLVTTRGMGGFLCPPGHPMHTAHVETDRRPEDRGCCCLETALKESWISEETKEEVRALMAQYEASKPGLDTPEVKAWVLQVMGYFRGCYRGRGPEPECWNAGNLMITRLVKPGEADDSHAGVHLIRRYYPEFKPTLEDFANAKWGS